MEPAGAITFERILQVAAAQGGVSVDAIKGRSRTGPPVMPRERAILLARRLRPDLSLPWLGRQLGRRDHTTVLYYHQAAEARLARDGAEAALLQKLLDNLGVAELPAYRPESGQIALLRRDVATAERQLAALKARLAELEARV